MQIPKATTLLHCHTHHSIKDSPLTIPDFVKRAKEMGIENLAINDHGTCTGWIEFKNECEKNGIRPILGVEAYVKTPFSNYAHLCLWAANYQGYVEISRFMSESNKNMVNIGGNMSAVGTMKMLHTYFESGNVFASSACINGIFGSIILHNHIAKRQIGKIERRRARYEEDNKRFHSTKAKEEAAVSEIERLTELRDQTESLAKMNLKYMKKALDAAAPGSSLYQKQKDAYDAKVLEKQEAQEKLTAIKKNLADAKKQKSAVHKDYLKTLNAHEKYEKLSEEIQTLEEGFLSDAEIDRLCHETLKEMQSIFPHKHFLIEMMYHGLEEEKIVMQKLCALAEECGAPIIATNDSHIAAKEQAESRAFMKSLRFSKWEDPSDADQELYMKDGEELFHALVPVIGEKNAFRAVSNTNVVGNVCRVTFPDVPHYPKYRDENGQIVKDAPALLRKNTYAGIPNRFTKEEFTQEYRDRMEKELSVIISLGYADYLLIVQDYITFAKEYSKNLDENHVGYGIGPGRGSACGSLVCYLLNITNVDPIKYNLLFERFLNQERVSMPDIDEDFSSEVRDPAIAYVKKKYGEACVACIRTSITQGAKGAIKNAARLRGFQKYGTDLAAAEKAQEEAGVIGDGKKSSGLFEHNKEEWEKKMKAVRSLGDTISAEIPEKTSIAACEKQLMDTFRGDDDAAAIIESAKKVENTITGTSIHAAGIIIGDGTPLRDIVPLMYNTGKGQWAVSCDMIEAEHDLKLLKMDFLGLNNLNFITDALRMIARKHQRIIDIDNIPLDDERVFAEIFDSAKTKCVFQFESEGMKKMLREFQPSTFEDLILLVAAYRPGPMQYLPDIISRKLGKTPTTYTIPELEPILKNTYGSIIYQEQVMEIFQKLAGYSLGYSDIVRRAMSKKHYDELEQERSAFLYGDPKRNIPGCKVKGIDVNAADKLFDEMMDFASYAFNKSHACAYAMISYQTAYLKLYYPAEYMCAVLNWSKVKDYPELLAECRNLCIRIYSPDINTSRLNFKVLEAGCGKGIVFGLHAIRGFADTAAQSILKEREKAGQFSSLQDLVLRTKSGESVLLKLTDAGALDCFGKGRRGELRMLIPQMVKTAAVIRAKEHLLESLSEEEAELVEKRRQIRQTIRDLKEEGEEEEQKEAEEDLKEVEKAMRSLKIRRGNAERTQEEAMKNLQTMCVEKPKEDTASDLKKEYGLLGAYVSGHPLDSYEYLYSSGTKRICDFEVENKPIAKRFAGIVKNLRKTKVHKEGPTCGKTIAFFTLEDKTGQIEACVFSKAYEEIHKSHPGILKENAILSVVAREQLADADSENEDQKQQLVVEKLEMPALPILYVKKAGNHLKRTDSSDYDLKIEIPNREYHIYHGLPDPE